MYQLISILKITFKRLWAQRGMTLATTAGLTMAVAIMMVVPLYADAVSFRLLEERLANQTNSGNRPPFSYMYSYIGAWRGPIQLEETREIDAYFRGTAVSTIPLPSISVNHHFETPIYQLFPTDTTAYQDEQQSLSVIKFATVGNIENHIQFVEGGWPSPAAESDVIEVVISSLFANALGWQVGEQYVAFNGRDETNTQQTFSIVVAGIWEPLDANSGYWIYQPNVYDDLFLVTETAFTDTISPAISDEINLATWYLVFDGSRVGTDDIDQLIGAANAVERRAQTLLPDISTFIAPTDGLSAYRRQVADLSTLLLAFNVPTIGVVLAFIGLVGGLAANQRRNEFAVLRSRGGTAVQLISVAFVEIVLIGGVAFLLGSGLSLLLTQGVGRARSFLDFSSNTPLRVAFTQDAIQAGLITIVIAIVAQMLPTIANARHTIISYKMTQARSLALPWWQRAGFDFILLGVAAYGFYTLQGQGGLVINSESGSFENPLLFWLPALTIFAVALFFLRLLPLLMRGLSWLLQQTDSIALLQASRYLARTPQQYNTPLVLLVLTVSFAVFTASLARTLDYYLYDAAYYQVGTDLNMFTSTTAAFSFGAPQSDAEAASVIIPVSSYEGIDGIERATRVGEFNGRIQVGNDPHTARYMGIDRLDFPSVAYWRWDFSRYRLGSLMNALGNAQEGVLLPRSFMRREGIQAGDTVRLTVSSTAFEVEYTAQIVGTFDYFPTWYEAEDELLVVGNLDYLFEQIGSEEPTRIWADTGKRPLDQDALRTSLNQLTLGATFWDEPHSLIATGLAQPERQGLFGLLSVGFIAASLLTILGLLLYTVFSYRRRLIELGVLRAVGLPARQMTRLVAWELALLILSGVVLGTLLGLGVSGLFIPYLQIGTLPEEMIPPFVIEVAWDAVSQVYILFGILFFLALVALVVLARRMKIFMAVKLGETV